VVANKLGLVTNGWGADWNDGFGFLSQIVDSRVIRPTGGSSNTSVRIPEVDKMLDTAIAETDAAKREKMWVADRQAGDGGGRDLPGLYAKACCSGRRSSPTSSSTTRSTCTTTEHGRSVGRCALDEPHVR
jgi:hypothetical protein